jgi:hypothetical protein
MPRKNSSKRPVDMAETDWLARRALLRQQEWALHEALLSAGEQALTRFIAAQEEASPAEIARLLSLGSELGRLSSGMPLSHSELQPVAAPAIRLEIEAALQKAYGGCDERPA